MVDDAAYLPASDRRPRPAVARRRARVPAGVPAPASNIVASTLDLVGILSLVAGVAVFGGT